MSAFITGHIYKH